MSKKQSNPPPTFEKPPPPPSPPSPNKICFYPTQQGLHGALAGAARVYIDQTIEAARRRPGPLTKMLLADLLGMDRNQLHRWLKALGIEL